MKEEFSEDVISNLDRIQKFTKDKKCMESTKNLIDEYLFLNSKTNSNLSSVIAQNLAWIAQKTKNAGSVQKAIQCFRVGGVINTIVKYRGDVADEVLTNIGYAIEPSQSKQMVERYVKWINNGHILSLLDVVSKFSENGGVKIKNDVFSVLGVEDYALEKFDEYASHLNNRKLSLQKKIEFLSILKDLVNMEKHDILEKINYTKTEALAKFLEKELGIRIARKIPSIKYGILLTEDRKKDRNLGFLIKKYKEHGSIGNWFEKDSVVQSVIGSMEDAGLRSKIFVSSGRKIKERRAEGNFSSNWTETFKHTVCKIVGSKSKKLQTKASIHGFAPNTIFHRIKADYSRALEGDKEAGVRTLAKIKEIIRTAYQNRKIPLPLRNVVNEIGTLEKSIEYGVPLSHKGAKITAKIWTRRVPEDLYHSDRLRCCVYLPYGEQGEEIPLFMMDPKTTILQYYVQGIEEHIAAATLYAGTCNEKPVIFLDTWDAGGLAYIALGHDKTKDFVIESLIKLGKMTDAASLIIFANAEYARPEEFCNHLRRRGFSSKNVHFRAVDAKDSVLQRYSRGRKHHYTDAYRWGRLEGKVEAFVVEV